MNNENNADLKSVFLKQMKVNLQINAQDEPFSWSNPGTPGWLTEREKRMPKFPKNDTRGEVKWRPYE